MGVVVTQSQDVAALSALPALAGSAGVAQHATVAALGTLRMAAAAGVAQSASLHARGAVGLAGVLRATLRGPSGEGTTGAWPETDIDAALDPKVTPAALDALIRKNVPSYANNQLGDFIQYAAMPDGYPAWMRAACAGCVDLGIAGADAAWKVCESVPTKPAFSQEWGCNIVPEAAA